MRCASPSKRKHPLSYLTRPVGPSVRQVIKTIGGLVPIVLLWLLPLFYAAIGRQSASTARMAAKLSLLWAECIVSSVSTAIVQVFLCDRFDDGDYLRAQLNLPCDNSPRRRKFVAFAISMLALYPIGE